MEYIEFNIYTKVNANTTDSKNAVRFYRDAI